MDRKLRHAVERGVSSSDWGSKVKMIKWRIRNLERSEERKKLIADKNKWQEERLYMLKNCRGNNNP